MNDQPTLHDIELLLGDQLADALTVRRSELAYSLLSTPSVADGTTVVLVTCSATPLHTVLLCSTHAAPHMVDRAMRRASEAKAMLGPVVGAPILDPIVAGRVNGLSYAVLPYCPPFSGARPLWWFQRAVWRRPLFGWLWQMTERSVVDVPSGEMDRRFVEPLRHLASQSPLSEHLRSAAREAAARLDGGAWTPRHVLMHGDLWKGNVLLRSAEGATYSLPRGNGFAVIDWAGSALEGYAIYDLVRLAQSMRMSSRSLRYEVARHCAILKCEPADARFHLLAALGQIGLTLESFPIARYAHMAEKCLTSIECATP